VTTALQSASSTTQGKFSLNLTGTSKNFAKGRFAPRLLWCVIAIFSGCDVRCGIRGELKISRDLHFRLERKFKWKQERSASRSPAATQDWQLL